MTCSIAVAAGSPVFSPSRVPLTCKAPSETLTLAHHHLHASAADASPSSPAAAASSLSSPFRLWMQRGASGLRVSFPKDISASSVDSSPASTSTSSAAAAATSTFLKRKRPARINIPPPIESLSFGAISGSGKETVEVESTRFSVLCKRGKTRKEMEDRYKAAVDVDGDPQLAFFGIFDGHGGTAAAAEFVAKNIAKHIMDEVNEVTIRSEEGRNLTEEAVKTGYLKTDEEFLKEEVVGGACSVTALIRKGDLVVSNTGDCRAVVSRVGMAEALTSDHRPSREDERSRIENLGGYVDCCRGVWRLQGSLAVSRGIGDRHLKQWVTAEPETKIIRIEPELEFLILASDGLWDKVSNQEAVDIARPMLTESDKPSLLSACRRLVDVSVSRGSVDDVSVMIIKLKHFV